MDLLAGKRIYRLQDDEGRGPFRPGFSETWLDAVRSYDLPPWFEEFGWHLVAECRDSGLNCGTGCRTLEQLHKWFSRTERKRLHRYGYDIVTLVPDRIFAESENQVVFGCREPLATPKIIL